jgi:hypothetical protein
MFKCEGRGKPKQKHFTTKDTKKAQRTQREKELRIESYEF